MKAKVTINTQYCLGRFLTKYSMAQKFLDSEVLRDSAPYVPMRTGFLRDSGKLGTKIGEGKVLYIAPYSRRMYYGKTFHFSKDKNPQACAEWFEKAKAVKKKAWMNGVDAIIRG